MNKVIMILVWSLFFSNLAFAEKSKSNSDLRKNKKHQILMGNASSYGYFYTPYTVLNLELMIGQGRSYCGFDCKNKQTNLFSIGVKQFIWDGLFLRPWIGDYTVETRWISPLEKTEVGHTWNETMTAAGISIGHEWQYDLFLFNIQVFDGHRIGKINRTLEINKEVPEELYEKYNAGVEEKSLKPDSKYKSFSQITFAIGISF